MRRTVAALVGPAVCVPRLVEVAAGLREHAGVCGGGPVPVLVGAAVGLLGLIHLAAFGVAVA